MGYALSIRFSSQDERDTMLAFLEQQDWDRINSLTTRHYAQTPQRGEHLGAYPPDDGRETMLGFAGTSIPSYAWVTCQWAAVKSSYRHDGCAIAYYDSDPIAMHVEGEPPLPEVERDLWGLSVSDDHPDEVNALGLRADDHRTMVESGCIDWVHDLEAQWQRRLLESVVPAAQDAPQPGRPRL